MLGGGHHEMYSTFLDIAAHHLQRNDCMYVIVKLERWTREPIDVDSSEDFYEGESLTIFPTMAGLTEILM